MENGMVKKKAEPQINVVISSLLDLAADKNESVRSAVENALRKISQNHTNEILKTVCTYRQSNPKLSNDHVAALLQPLEEICLEHIVEIDGDTVLLLIDFCVDEMVKNPEYVPNVQLSASALLVALGKKHCIQVMEGVLKKFTVGTVPHYTIPHTMGALASTNAFGVIPFLKSVLGTALPMLGMLKTEPLKQSFAFALGKFCEAINEYMSNIASAPDPTIDKELYSTEIAIAYELLASSWLQSRDPKLLDTVLIALGSMFSILPKDKVTEHSPKLITTLLLLYKKQKDIYSVSQCLATVLLVICELNKNLLDSQIDNLLNTLSEVVYASPDFTQPETIKNQSEVLRCFDRISKYFCDKTVDHLLQMLKNNHEKDKIKALLVITHLINSKDSSIKTRIHDVINMLRHMLNDSNVKVKITLLKTIVAFAYHGHFFNPDGAVFISFIIKLCCTPNAVNAKGVQDLDSTEWFEMIRTCDNSLFLLTSTVIELENTLWKLFLESLLNKDYNEACCVLLRCLTNLALRKKEALKIGSDIGPNLSNIPSSETIFARCITMLSSPLNANRGTYILNFLRNYVLHVHKHLQALWDLQIPQLLKYLEQYTDTWDNKIWEDKVLEFLTCTIKEVDEIKWTETLASKLMEQVPLYNDNGEEKGFLFKCLATATCFIEDVNCVKQKIDVILGSAKLNNMIEADACARAVAICSRIHLASVLLKLNTIRREELVKRTSKFLSFNINFMKDVKHEVEIEKLRYTVIACYSELVLEAPSEKLLITIEHEILNWVVQELHNTKEFQIRQICLTAIGNIAEAMHPTRNVLHIRMQQRDEVLNIVLSQLQLHSGAEYIELFPTIIPVITSLVKLRNELESEQRVNIMKMCFDTIYNAAAIYCKLNISDNNVSYGDLKLAPNVFNSFKKLNDLTQALLLQSVSPATLDDILTMLEPWLGKRKPEQRLPAIENVNSVLDCYLKNMKFAYEAPSQFGQTGFILGRLVPRCTDPNTNIRLVALECVRLVLCIAARYEGHMSDYNNEIGTSLDSLRQDIETNDPKLLFSITSDLAKVVSKYLPHFQLMHFTESLLDGLLDHEPSSSSGSSVTLNVFLKLKGGELYQHVSDIVLKLVKYMNEMNCPKTRSSSVRSVLALAVHHPKAVTSVLLTYPLPYENCVSDCWMMLAHDNTLSADIVEQFKRLFSTISLYDEQQNSENLRIVTLQPLAAVCALREMFRNIQMQDIVISQLPELFAILLMIVSSYIGTSPPIYTPQQTSTKKEKYSFIPNREAYKINPAKVALETCKLLLLCAKCDRVAEVFLQSTVLESSSSLLPMIDLMPSLADNIFSSCPHIVQRLVTALNVYAVSNFEPQRIVATAFFVEVVKHRGNGQPILVETIMTTLLNSQTDQNAMVRQLSLRGLSYVSHLDEEYRSRHCSFVFSALIQGLDDPEARCNQKPRSDFVLVTQESFCSTFETNIPLEAMLGLSKMLHAVEEKHLDAIQVSTAVRIKPFYEKEDSALRSAAFRLFGDLAMSFGSNYHVEAFKEQVSGNFICLLLHLSDENADVVKACKYTLRQVTPFLEAPKLNTMIQNHLIDEGNLHYSEFISDLIKIMTEELPDVIPLFIMNAIQFVKGHWSEIRGNAALMVGFLYSQLPKKQEISETVQFDTVCFRLMQLLQDEDSDVRAKAVQGLSYLFVS